jgi:hypothetical protein
MSGLKKTVSFSSEISVDQFQNREMNFAKKEKRKVDAETVCNKYREATIHRGYLHNEQVEKKLTHIYRNNSSASGIREFGRRWHCAYAYFSFFLFDFFEERTKDPIENAKKTTMSVFTFAIAMANENRLAEPSVPLWNRRPIQEYDPRLTSLT